MKIKVSDLRTILSHLKSGLSGNKETTDQSGSFVFADGMAYTYNDEISVSAPFDLGIEGAVSSKELLSLAEKLKGEEAIVSMEENELHIVCGRSRAGIRLDSEIRMPLDQIVLGDIKWNPLPAEFKQAIKDTLFSTSKDMSIPVFTTINCKRNRIESTDNDRATLWVLPKVKSLNFLLPADAAKLLVQYNGKIEKWGKSEDWIHFKIEDIVFSCRTFDEKFPDLTPHFKVEGSEFEFPEIILSILDKAEVFIDAEFEQDKLVAVSISNKGVMKVRAEGDNGWFEESTRTKYKGKEIEFNINPQYLQKILSYVNTAILGEDRILFVAENFKHVVALEVDEE